MPTYACILTCMHTYIHTYMYLHIRIQTHIHTIMYTYILKYIHECIHTCMHTYNIGSMHFSCGDGSRYGDGYICRRLRLIVTESQSPWQRQDGVFHVHHRHRLHGGRHVPRMSSAAVCCRQGYRRVSY